MAGRSCQISLLQSFSPQPVTRLQIAMHVLCQRRNSFLNSSITLTAMSLLSDSVGYTASRDLEFRFLFFLDSLMLTRYTGPRFVVRMSSVPRRLHVKISVIWVCSAVLGLEV